MEGVEDGQSKNRRGVTRVSSGGCSSFPILGDRRDHDDEGHGSHGGRSWRDTLLGRGRTGKSKMPVLEAPRHRSRTPASRQRRSSRGRSVERASPPAPDASLLRATPPLPLQPRAPPPPPEEDLVAQFFSFSDSGRTLEPPPRTSRCPSTSAPRQQAAHLLPRHPLSPAARARTPPRSTNARAAPVALSQLVPLLLSLPGTLDHSHEHPRALHSLSNGHPSRSRGHP